MKKQTIALLAALLAVSSLAGCGQRAAQSGPQEPAVSASAADPVLQSSSAAPAPRSQEMAKLLESGHYYLDCTVVLDMDGLQLTNDMKVASRGGDHSVTVSSQSGELKMVQRMLSLDGKFYMMDDDAKTYSELRPEQAQGGFNVDFSGMVYQGEGEAVFDGQTLPYEEYRLGELEVRLFYDGQTLVGLTHSVQDDRISEIALRIKGLSSNIPAGLLEIPPGYTAATH